MKAILLAAGVGDRLRPFTDSHPKCLVEVGGRSLLDRHLDILSGIEAITGLHIVVGYLADQIREGGVTNITFGEAPGQETIGCVAAVCSFGSVHVQDGCGFVGNIH